MSGALRRQSDSKQKARQERGSLTGHLCVWRPEISLNRPLRQPPRNGERGLACLSLWRLTGALRMTRALTLAQLAAQYGVTDAAIAALPDAPKRVRHDGLTQVRGPALTQRRKPARDRVRIERRRRWAASGYMPPQLACRCTTGELAALSVIANQVLRSGQPCRLTIGAIAAMSGSGRTTVQNAIRAARIAGFLTTQERRVPSSRSMSNVVRIVSKEWLAWLARRRRPSDAPGAAQTPPRPRHDTKGRTRHGAHTSERSSGAESSRPPGFRNESASLDRESTSKRDCPKNDPRSQPRSGMATEREPSQTVPEMAECGTVETEGGCRD